MGSLSTVTIYCHYLLSLSTVTIYCHYLLSLSTVTIYCHYLLSLSTVTIYCHYLLSLTVTIYCHCLLSLSTVTVYCHYLLSLSTVTLSHSPSNGCQKLLDSSLAEELEQEKRAAVRNYKEWRNSILSLREEERRQRNLLKQQQVELVEEWQVHEYCCM